jgi:hypothetical protein
MYASLWLEKGWAMRLTKAGKEELGIRIGLSSTSDI